jgi:CRISPR-associated exonuclease Cas4
MGAHSYRQQWSENRHTEQGHVLRRVVDEGLDESHSGFRIARSLPLRSFRLGLVSKADVVISAVWQRISGSG